MTTMSDNEENTPKKQQKYKALDRFNDPSSVEYRTRLNDRLMHSLLSITDFNQKGNRRIRLRCIMCCYKCVNGTNQQHVRLGRISSKFYPICKVVLCQHCFDTFHTISQLAVPECVSNKVGMSKGKRICQPVYLLTQSKTKVNVVPSPFVRKRKTKDINSSLLTDVRNLEVTMY